MAKISAVEYKPFEATVSANKNNPDKLVVFIGRQLCFFERDVDASSFKSGDVIEVMITRALHAVNPEGHKNAGKPDYNSLRALIVQPVNREIHTLVSIDGFERDMDTKKSVATGTVKGRKTKLTLYPGLTGAYQSVGDQEKIPMNVWILTESMTEQKEGPIKTIGLTSIDDGRWARLIHVPHRRQ